MPDAMELLARSLRAGHTLSGTLDLVSQEIPAPLGTEMRITYDEQKLGLSMTQAFRRMGERVASQDLRYCVTAVIIQSETGGNLAEILENIGLIIRDRLKLKGKVQGLTAEGRFSALILSLLPFVTFLALYVINRAYVMTLFHDPLGIQIVNGRDRQYQHRHLYHEENGIHQGLKEHRMTVLFWVIAIASFGTIAFLTYGVLSYYDSRKVMRDRFRSAPSDAMPLIYRGEANSFKKRFLNWVSSLGTYAVDEKQDDSALRQSLIQAGFRHPKGTAIYFGLRFLLALLLPVLYLAANVMNGVLSRGNLLVCFLLAAGGFYVVPYLLKFLTRRRQDRIDRALPDVLDLLIVCMEAGLSLQATINRVSDEVKNISTDLYRELQLTNAELRTGISPGVGPEKPWGADRRAEC